METSSTRFHEFLESMISSSKASISVILVLFYGYILRKLNYITPEGEKNISQLGTTFLLPALLFSEIGPLATFESLRTYWTIIPLTLFFQLVSLLVGIASHKLRGMSRHYVPIFVFNNVTSLPLLLIDALAATGSLDELVPKGELLASIVSRGRVYILINALVGNLTRFAFGPYLIKTHAQHFWKFPHNDNPLEVPKSNGAISLGNDESELESETNKFVVKLKSIKSWIIDVANPPLVGGVSAIIFGIIPFLHQQFFDSACLMSPIANSINNIGNLYTALQMLVLGAHLYSKKGTSASPFALLWLFIYRFFLTSAVSIGTICFLRHTFPQLLNPDPILYFILMISNVGPPALTLSAIAQMADLSSEIEGQIAKIILLSYVFTPFIAFPITAILAVLKEM